MEFLFLWLLYGFIAFTGESQKLPVEMKWNTASIQTKQTVHKTKPNTEVVAVVTKDFAIKNYTSPDPYKYFFQKQTLEVKFISTYSKIPWTFWPVSAGVGGDGYDLAKRVILRQTSA